MINNSEKLVFLAPCRDGAVTKHFSKGSHWGIDIGWSEDKTCPILAIQDGKVVDNFYSDSCGYSIVLQHDYQDGTHRWSAYIHLNKRSDKPIGYRVKQGDQIGNKGNTGKSNGYHLHIGVSDLTTKMYNWETMKSLCNFDIEPYFYRWKNVEYIGSWFESMDYIENHQVKYPYPVERNEEIDQVQVLIDYLYLRDEPNGNAYADFTIKGIYNILDKQQAGNYNWYKIGEGFWIASGGSRTKDLPSNQSREAQLEKQVEELQSKIGDLAKSLETVKKSLDLADSKLNAINKILAE